MREQKMEEEEEEMEKSLHRSCMSLFVNVWCHLLSTGWRTSKQRGLNVNHAMSAKQDTERKRRKDRKAPHRMPT